jgi:type VI secretion system protein ImpB
MSYNFEGEVPKARISISVDLHAGGSLERVELPLKLLVLGDYSAGKAIDSLAERKILDVNQNNFDAVLAELNPEIRVDLANALEGSSPDSSVALGFKSMKDFDPERVAGQIPQLQRLVAMRNLLRDLKSNLLDNSAFRIELERIVKNASLSDSLIAELRHVGAMEPT